MKVDAIRNDKRFSYSGELTTQKLDVLEMK